MFCPKCRTSIQDNTICCGSCGEIVHPLLPPPIPQDIPNYLVLSLLFTIFFCPTGIIALRYGAQVKRRLSKGDVQGALAASRKARMWNWISFGAGAVIALAYSVLVDRVMASISF